MANRKKAKQARKNHGMGFINPPYQNGQTNYPLPQAQKKVVLPVFHKMAQKGG